jgi:hypothetical protein
MKFAPALGVALALWLAIPGVAPLCAQESLEGALLRYAPELIKYSRQRPYHTVGVLKFLVQREGQDNPSDNVGTFNRLLARQLEYALALSNDPQNPVGIIRDASAVAHQTPGASHKSLAGCRKLFEPSYPLAWGQEKVKADAFFTGLAHISKDLKTLTVQLQVLDRQANLPGPVPDLKPFQVAMVYQAGNLSAMGESYLLREGFGDEKPPDKLPAAAAAAAADADRKSRQNILNAAVKLHDKEVPHPVKRADAPVTLTVSYNGKSVPYDVQGDKAFIPEPAEGQAVALKLQNHSAAATYGVVLKVNGESTLGKEREPDLYCRRWVLGPKEEGTVRGYVVARDTKLVPFKVLSVAESKAQEVNYGPDVGTITMTVYRAAQGPPLLAKNAADKAKVLAAAKEKVLAQLPHLPEAPNTSKELMDDLLEAANQPKLLSRGLIVPGGAEEAIKLEEMEFRPDPSPVMVVTIFYRPAR